MRNSKKAGFGGKKCEIEDPCGNNTCQNGGTCQPTSRLQNESFFCVCLPQYAGSNCEIENECFKNPCKNKGSCILSIDGEAKCICTQDHTGQYCETIKSLCSTEPCLNNGICISKSTDSYLCVCLRNHFF